MTVEGLVEGSGVGREIPQKGNSLLSINIHDYVFKLIQITIIVIFIGDLICTGHISNDLCVLTRFISLIFTTISPLYR